MRGAPESRVKRKAIAMRRSRLSCDAFFLRVMYEFCSMIRARVEMKGILFIDRVNGSDYVTMWAIV